MSVINADWPAPNNIHAFTTLRTDGVSEGCYASLNLGDHVQDDPKHVTENRKILRQQLPMEPAWLKQTHSNIAVYVDKHFKLCEADASYTDQAQHVCAVLTADCLPLLICNKSGTEVAAIHAGWGGLAKGIIETTIKQLQSAPEDLLVWLAPAIGPNAFEVGADVYDKFIQYDPKAESAFQILSQNKWLMDIYHLGRLRLNDCGVHAIYGGDFCTYSQAEQFFSYRRDGNTGRMASLIWLD